MSETQLQLVRAWSSVLPIIALFATIIVTVLWIVIGWRAMRAHERLADAVESIARGRGDSPQDRL
jgi:hypothetical protein